MAKKQDYRAMTIAELKVFVDRNVVIDPNCPVKIGTCVCGSRVIAFTEKESVDCPRCMAETSVKPIIVRALPEPPPNQTVKKSA